MISSCTAHTHTHTHTHTHCTHAPTKKVYLICWYYQKNKAWHIVHHDGSILHHSLKQYTIHSYGDNLTIGLGSTSTRDILAIEIQALNVLSFCLCTYVKNAMATHSILPEEAFGKLTPFSTTNTKDLPSRMNKYI